VFERLLTRVARALEDAESILLKNPGFDRRYIEGWLRKLDKAFDTRYIGSFKKVIRHSR
jgi:hypothetical protein